MTAGDLNGDGKSDLVVVNLLATVSILFNTTASGAATPSFAARQDFAVGDGPRSVSIGDLNLDGKLDLAVVNLNSNNVAVLLNTTDPGAATPSFSAVHAFPTGIRPISVAAGDLNGDGKLDLAVVADFLDVVIDRVVVKDGVKGRLTASLSLEGSWGDAAVRRGRGDVIVSGRDMYRIPLVLGEAHLEILRAAGEHAPHRADLLAAHDRTRIERVGEAERELHVLKLVAHQPHHAAEQFDGRGETAGHLRERGEEQVADRMPVEFAVRETMLQQATERGVRPGGRGQAVSNVSWRQHSESLTQA